MRPTVSVVMSVFNDERYLPEAAQSILLQEGVTFEFVVVDDGSTDRSAEILAALGARDGRMHVIRRPNEGLTAALIRGCEAARGRYIARQDADDLSLPGRLARLARRLDEDPRLVFVSSWAQRIGPEGEVFGEIRRPADPEEATRLLLDANTGPPGHGSVMFRADAYRKVGGYRPQFYYGQDGDLWLRLAEHGLLAYEQEVLYAYRYTPDGISTARRPIQRRFGRLARACRVARREGRPEDALLQEVASLRERAMALRLREGGRVGRRRVAAAHYQIGAGLRARGDARAREYFRRAVKAYPLHWRAWLRLVEGAWRRGAARDISRTG